MRLAKEWNNSNSQDKETKLSMQNKRIYILGNKEHANTDVVSRNDSVADFQARVQGLYGQTNESNKERENTGVVSRNEGRANFQAKYKACTDRLTSLMRKITI